MSDQNTTRKATRYALLAFIIGLVFPAGAFILGVLKHDLFFTFESFGWLHVNNPVYYFLDVVPLLTAISTYLFAQKMQKRIQKAEEKFELEIYKTENVYSFINNLINGQLDAKLSMDSDAREDKLGTALINLRDNLKKNQEEELKRKKEDEQRNWVTEGLAKFGEILRKNNDNIEELSYNIVSNLVKYINGNQGGFFIINEDDENEKFFEQTASFAYDRKKFADRRIEWGEGLIGTCAMEKETIYMMDIPDTYVHITSGLGESTPKSLLIVPLVVNEEIHGVVELASFEPLEKYVIEFVEKIAESIATTISSVKINMRTARLLKESQEQAKTMAEQEEQMRQNMEELQATQEEATRQGEKLTSFTNSVNHTLIRAEYMTDGTLIYANTKFLNKLGYSSNQEVEGKHISMFISEKDREWFDGIWDNLAAGGRHFEGDMKHVTKQGNDLWTMATYTCVRRDDDSVEKILFLAIDTTDQKKQSLDFEGQIDALNNSSIKLEFTPGGDLIDCNEIFLENYNYTAPESKDLTIYSILAKSEHENFNNIWEQVIQGVPYQGQIKTSSKSGKEKWLRGTFSSVNDMYGEVNKVILIAHDMTKEKLMEFETRKQTEQLKIQEEKLRLSGIELSKKLDQAKAEMKQQFKEIEKIKIRNERTLEGALDAIVTS
ncbi:MAG: PAS domain S-box protein, partial [Bacteroidota bacterium]